MPELVQSRWTNVGGLKVHARVSTPAVLPGRPPVVLVHGMVVASAYMVPLAERLAPTFRVYAPDLPGYGESSKPPELPSVGGLADALADWTQALHLPRAIFIGNSFGCQILAEFAVRYSERLDRLVLQGPTTDPRGRTFPEQLRRIWRNSRLEKGAMAAITRHDYARAGWRRVWRTIRIVMADRIEDKLPRIEAPVLVVVGSRDPLVPITWARRATEMIPQGQLVVVSGATHTMNYVAPDDFARAIQPFLLDSPTVFRGRRLNVVGA